MWWYKYKYTLQKNQTFVATKSPHKERKAAPTDTFVATKLAFWLPFVRA